MEKVELYMNDSGMICRDGLPGDIELDEREIMEQINVRDAEVEQLRGDRGWRERCEACPIHAEQTKGVERLREALVEIAGFRFHGRRDECGVVAQSALDGEPAMTAATLTPEQLVLLRRIDEQSGTEREFMISEVLDTDEQSTLTKLWHNRLVRFSPFGGAPLTPVGRATLAGR